MSDYQLQPIQYLAKRLGVKSLRAYELVRQNIFDDGVIVRLGRSVRVNPQ